MEPLEEIALKNWVEAPQEKRVLSMQERALYFGGALLLAGIFLVAGIFSHDWSWYLAMVVVIVAAASMIVQYTHDTPPQEVFLTNQRIIIGKHSYPLTNLSGFWLQHEGGNLVIMIEMKHATLMPIMCTYSNANEQEARDTMRSVLPEVEARQSHFTDKFSRYFRF